MAVGPLGWLLYMEGCCAQPAEGSQKELSSWLQKAGEGRYRAGRRQLQSVCKAGCRKQLKAAARQAEGQLYDTLQRQLKQV